jgi:uncharacterized RDD family membrane protein YckC
MNQIAITTTQNVNINFNLASVGDRLLAYIVDFLIRAAYVFVVLYLLFGVFDLERLFDKKDMWSIMAVFSLILLPYFLYNLVMETFFEGQTLGKKLLKIKAVKIDGYQAGFGDFLIRWLFSIVDFSIIGIIVISSSKKSQRLGDMAAGTAVISLKNDVTIKNTILEELDNQYVPIYPAVIKLSDNDVRIIKETFTSALTRNDYELINKLREKVENVTGIKNISGNDRDFIRTIIKDYNFYTQNM